MRNLRALSLPSAPALMIAAALFTIDAAPTAAQTAGKGVHPTPAPVVGAVRRTSTINLDGKLDEEVWRTPNPATGFRQSQPDEGKEATQKTEVRFAYDDEAIYVGARMFDDKGAAGVRSRLMRRDAMTENDSDILQIIFDSYHSHNSSYFFWVNPAGSKRDGTGDPTWDPVWETATNIDSLGWTAELRIPFNQLNFSRAVDQTWGVQILRFVHRLNERSHFAWWASNESGGPQRYGHLEGIKISERPRGMEVMPYTVARARYIRPADPTNPFTKDNDRDYRFGGDIKYRLT
ncbi:MAG TPA: carbohydrate binding family 9 domain-containing protein, partial [Gemmatimonadaceae bacterium]|nr:carbohydrate binding family 9 domain-containing protein [Gemmatimonadaceae bacterium]